MSQLLEFAGNHMILVGALIMVVALLAQNLIADIGDKSNLGPQAATDLINREEALVVDVRPMADFSKGHIVGAMNIPMNGFANQLHLLEKHRDRPILIGCRSGAQSQMACSILRKKGFEKVYNLRGGILAWQSANMPTSRK